MATRNDTKLDIKHRTSEYEFLPYNRAPRGVERPAIVRYLVTATTGMSVRRHAVSIRYRHTNV